MRYDRYYYSQLNKREKLAYKSIYNAMRNHEKSVTVITPFKIDLHRLFTAITLDNPHLFYVDFFYTEHWDLFSQKIELTYIYDKIETEILTKRIKKICSKILSKVTGENDFEKELSLHDLLVKNIVYDNIAKQNLEKYRFKSNTILGPLFYKTAVCEGIAKIFKLLLNALDIKCIIVTGKASGSIDSSTKNNDDEIFHAWNIVKIGGQAYHIDLTWNINLSNKNMICHNYFNLSTKEFSLDHEVNSNLPQCYSKIENYYYKNKLIISQKSDLRRIIHESVKNRISLIEVKILNNSFLNDLEIMKYAKEIIDLIIFRHRNFSITCLKQQHNIYFLNWTFM